MAKKKPTKATAKAAWPDGYVTPAEYARHRGVSRQMVSEWREKGRLVIEDRGPRNWRVNVEQSDRRLDATRDPMHDYDEVPDLQAARLRYELARAEEAELKVAKLRGDLVSREAVEATVSRFIMEHRERLLELPVRVGRKHAAKLGCDALALEVALEDELHRHLRDMAKVELRLSEEDAKSA